MENKLLLTDDLLWDYADALLTTEQMEQVDHYLQQHPEWRERLQMIRAEKQELAAVPLESPDRGFADRVMAAWAAEQVKTKTAGNGKDWIIRLIALVFVLFILTPIVLLILNAPQIAPVDLPAVEMPELPVVNWSAILDSTVLQYGLLLAFALAGLRLLDKFLQQRFRTHQIA
ncbi:MAG: hypothetical protein EP344_15120 [Bacteroidetes bacterium]|nr:MAG: hypothetical protein EP344_15120 [Bacteroidota bacterium]